MPPRKATRCSSMKLTLTKGSSNRDGRRSGRKPTWSVRSATRAALFAERTDENVAMARTSVPPAVAADAIVAQSAMRPSSVDSGSVLGGGGEAGRESGTAARRRRRLLLAAVTLSVGAGFIDLT